LDRFEVINRDRRIRNLHCRLKCGCTMMAFSELKMMTEKSPIAQMMWLGLAMLVFFSGLCTIFAAVVTAGQAWQEHARANWPGVTARVERCGLDRTSTGRRRSFYIDCRLSYSVAGAENIANVYSGHVPAADDWQYPPNQIGPLQEWLGQHPSGTAIAVRYDPDNHTKVVLVVNDMPRGPHTEQCEAAGNLRGNFPDSPDDCARHVATIFS
jgi:hypothetical protein